MNQIKWGAIISYITVAFNIISGLFFTPFLIEKVGSNVYGVYTLVITFLNYFLIDFGLGNSVSKYISFYRTDNKQDKINEFASVIFKLFFTIAIIIGIILSILYFFVEKFFTGLTEYEITILKKMYIISGTSAVSLFLFIPLDGILTAYEKFFELKFCELFRKVTIIALSVMALEVSCNIIAVSAVNAIVGFIVVGIKIGIVKRTIPIKIKWQYFSKDIFVQVAGFSVWLTIIMIAQRFIIPIAPTILGRFSNANEISIFSIATTVEGYIYTIASCLNGLFLPKLTEMLVKGKNQEINNLFIIVGRIQSMIIGLIITCFIIFGKEFLNIWVGEKFLKSYWVILLLIVPTIITYSQEIANSILIIEHEKLKYKAVCYIIGAIISTLISAILSNELGSIGAGIGIAVCLWGCHVFAMNIIYYKKTILDIKYFFITCYGKFIPIMVIITISVASINQFFETYNLFFLSIKIFAFILLYSLLYWGMILKNEERQAISRFIKKRNDI